MVKFMDSFMVKFMDSFKEDVGNTLHTSSLKQTKVVKCVSSNLN